MSEIGWDDYFRATQDQPAMPLYAELDRFFDPPGHVIDLGCGAGRGTLHLLARGFRVTATDAEQSGLDRLEKRLPPDADVEMVHARFEELNLATYDAAVASLSLFFMSHDAFAEFWPMLVYAIRPGGFLAADFLGPNDDWSPGRCTAQSREELDAMLDEFEMLSLVEIDEDGRSLEGPKHWHRFQVVARKI